MTVRATSRLAYDVLKPDLPKRQAEVMRALFAFHAEHHHWPTGYELFMAMRKTNPLLDLNGARPRLTELKKLQRVQEGPKRHCAITQRLAMTWEPVESPRMF